MIPKSVYSNWDRAITKALSGSTAADTEDEADMDLNEADFSDKATHPAHRPPSTVTGKGKAPARSVTALELSTDSESDDLDVQIIGTTAVAERRSNPASQASLITTTNDEVAPSQSLVTIPRATVHTPNTFPASESDDEFFFTNLIAHELADAGKFTTSGWTSNHSICT